MFGSSNNQNQPGQDVSQQAANHGFTMDAPADPAASSPAPLSEPTASPVSDATSAPHVDDTVVTNVVTPPPADPPVSLPPMADSSNGDSGVGTDLMSIKQQALSQLSPIVNHLDQSPEDKFKTIMMMIQANDNQDLIKNAYEAAQQIPDEKVKSQALLDVINEINYFTQNKDS